MSFFGEFYSLLFERAHPVYIFAQVSLIYTDIIEKRGVILTIHIYLIELYLKFEQFIHFQFQFHNFLTSKLTFTMR